MQFPERELAGGVRSQAAIDSGFDLVFQMRA